MTNREWLNSLSDEEFLEIMASLCGEIPESECICNENGVSCFECQLQWLKKERVE